VGKIARHCDQDATAPRNFAHVLAPKAAWATRQYALQCCSTLPRVAHPTKNYGSSQESRPARAVDKAM
jgi:hypothetical protein